MAGGVHRRNPDIGFPYSEAAEEAGVERANQDCVSHWISSVSYTHLDVRFGTTRRPEDNCYTFMIDAVTGEGFLATYGRTLSVKVDLGLDASLAKDPGEYMKLAKEFAEKKKMCIRDRSRGGLNGPPLSHGKEG